MNIEPYFHPPIMILHFDSEGKIIQVDGGWQRFTRYSAENSIEKDFGEFLSQESREIYSEIGIQGLLSAGWPEGVPCQILTKEGEQIDVWVQASSVQADGQIQAGVVVLGLEAEPTDPLNSADGEFHQHQKELLMRSLSNFTDVVPWHFEFSTMRFTSVGHQSLDVFGYPPESFTDLDSWANRIHPEDRQKSVEFCMAESKGGRNHALEFRMITANDEIIWIRDVVTVIVENGEPVELLGMFLDITHLKETQEKLSFQVEVDEAVGDLSRALLSSNLSETARLTLQYARSITKAEHGYVSVIDPITKENVGHTLTEMLGNACKVSEENKRITFPPGPDGTYPGLIGYSLNTHDSFFTNDPPSYPAFAGSSPAGHIPIHNFLSVPALIGDKLVGQIALANSPVDFDSTHLEAVQQLADVYALAIERARLARVEKESQAIFRSLVESTNVIPWSMDLATNNFTYVGPQLANLLGISSDSFGTLEDWAAVVHPDDRDFAMNYCLIETQHGRDHVFEYRMVTADGEVIWIRDVVAVIKQENKPVGLVGFFVDITNLKKSEQELSDFNQELEERVRERTFQLQEANRELESFSYSVAHDLRAPLRALRGFSEILLEEYAGQLDETAQSYLKRIYGSSKNMNELISDLLDLSRLGRRQLNLQQVDLNQVASQVFALLTEKDESLDIEFKAAFGKEVFADSTMMELLFSNLIDNAIKYSQPKGKIIIEMGEQVLEGEPVYFIRDNGIGFDMAYAEKIFAPFQRLHSSEEFSGSGIGLAIVKRIVGLHNGRIWVESELDEGTTFFFTLNARQISMFSRDDVLQINL